MYELDLVEAIVDAGVSAKTLDRPGLGKALGMLKAKRAEPLLVVKLDRLTRSVVHLGQLIEDYFEDGKWALRSVGEQIDTRSAAGRLALNILAVFRSGNEKPSASGPRRRCSIRRALASTPGGLPLWFQPRARRRAAH